MFHCTNPECKYGPAWDAGKPIPHNGPKNTVLKIDRAFAYAQCSPDMDFNDGLCLNCIADRDELIERSIPYMKTISKAFDRELITCNLNDPSTMPPKDGSWVEGYLEGDVSRLRKMQYDVKLNRWFDDKNHAVSGIFQWYALPKKK